MQVWKRAKKKPQKKRFYFLFMADPRHDNVLLRLQDSWVIQARRRILDVQQFNTEERF